MPLCSPSHTVSRRRLLSHACWCLKTVGLSKTAIRASWRAIPNRASMRCSKPKAPSTKSSGITRSGVTSVCKMANSLPDTWLWPTSRLGEALCLLTSGPSVANPQPPIPQRLEALAHWLESAALSMGFEAQPAETTYADFERHLKHMGPALLHVPTDAGPAFLAILPGATLLTPALTKLRVDP